MMRSTLKASLVIILALLMLSIVVADSPEDLAAAKVLIDESTACDQLTEDQRALIGDYYMELMHPGEAHELMDARMGGEGSEQLRAMHLHLADRFYCNTDAYEMMGDFGNKGLRGGKHMMDYGMGSSYGAWHMGYGILKLVLFMLGAFVFSLIFWGTQKLLNPHKKKRR
jgi:hypothetical protein